MNKLTINHGHIEKKLNGATTIFIPERSELINFNKTGSYIFSKIKKGWTEQHISDSLATRYNISKEKAAEDVSSFIKQLCNKKLLSYEK